MTAATIMTMNEPLPTETEDLREAFEERAAILEYDAREPALLFERFRLVYPSDTVVESYYCGGATLREVQVTHPIAIVEAVEDSLVGVGSRA